MFCNWDDFSFVIVQQIISQKPFHFHDGLFKGYEKSLFSNAVPYFPDDQG